MGEIPKNPPIENIEYDGGDDDDNIQRGNDGGLVDDNEQTQKMLDEVFRRAGITKKLDERFGKGNPAPWVDNG